MTPPSSFTRREVLGAMTATVVGSKLRAKTPRPPNVIFILCDDLGFGDLECYGSAIKTPHLDRMAAEGIHFTNFCSADPVCSPSRAALLTGRYPTRVGVPRVLFPQDKGGLNLDEKTLANVLKGQGYRTSCVGKWHLGRPAEYLPTNRGFDEYFGIPYSNDMTPRILMHNTDVVEDPAKLDTLTERYTEYAARFIQASKDAPFFLYFAHTFPHIPLAASPRFQGKSGSGLYGDVVEEIDWSVGEVLRTLKEAGLDHNTVLMFSSDNGPWYQGSPGKLRGRKDSTYEGGIREPFIARWPGKIPAGRTCNALGSMLDVFPTITKLCGGKVPDKPLDGISIWPLLTGAEESIRRDPLLYFNLYNLQCARWNNWKLHVARYNTAAYVPPPAGGVRNYLLPRPELYNLANDPDESYDVAPQHPDVVRSILERIDHMINTFPEPVQQAWVEARARKVDSTMPVGAWPRPQP